MINHIQLKLVEGAREALITLSTKYRIVLITGRQEVFSNNYYFIQEIWKESTEYWINHNLEGVPIEKLIYANDRYCDNVPS